MDWIINYFTFLIRIKLRARPSCNSIANRSPRILLNSNLHNVRLWEDMYVSLQRVSTAPKAVTRRNWNSRDETNYIKQQCLNHRMSQSTQISARGDTFVVLFQRGEWQWELERFTQMNDTHTLVLSLVQLLSQIELSREPLLGGTLESVFDLIALNGIQFPDALAGARARMQNTVFWKFDPAQKVTRCERKRQTASIVEVTPLDVYPISTLSWRRWSQIFFMAPDNFVRCRRWWKIHTRLYSSHILYIYFGN